MLDNLRVALQIWPLQGHRTNFNIFLTKFSIIAPNAKTVQPILGCECLKIFTLWKKYVQILVAPYEN